jgi:hypothetical protein
MRECVQQVQKGASSGSTTSYTPATSSTASRCQVNSRTPATIREALTEFNARQIQLLFALQVAPTVTFNNASREEMASPREALKISER